MSTSVTPIRQGELCSIENQVNHNYSVEPKLLDDFVLTRMGEVIIGKETHKYLVEEYLNKKDLALNLDKGFETFDSKPQDERKSILPILKYILQKSQPGQTLKDVLHESEFVCYRGNLTKVAASPYEVPGDKSANVWKFAVTKFNDIFFLMELETDARAEERENETSEDKKGIYRGHKFETYIFAKEGEMPDTEAPVSTWEEIGAFFVTSFPKNGKNKPEVKVFYSAEIDGLDKDGKHVEAKTQFKDLFIGKFFEKKAMKWYLQSTLVGIKDVVVGFRTNSGIVNHVKMVNLEKLEEECGKWNSNVCFGTVQHVLNNIRSVYNQEIKAGEMLIVERKPNSKKVEFQVVPKESYKILTEEFKKRFAPTEKQDRGMKRQGSPDPFQNSSKKACI